MSAILIFIYLQTYLKILKTYLKRVAFWYHHQKWFLTWQVVFSVTPQTILWMPSTQTFNSILKSWGGGTTLQNQGFFFKGIFDELPPLVWYYSDLFLHFFVSFFCQLLIVNFRRKSFGNFFFDERVGDGFTHFQISGTKKSFVFRKLLLVWWIFSVAVTKTHAVGAWYTGWTQPWIKFDIFSRCQLLFWVALSVYFVWERAIYDFVRQTLFD